jgi:hypothetical protein
MCLYKLLSSHLAASMHRTGTSLLALPFLTDLFPCSGNRQRSPQLHISDTTTADDLSPRLPAMEHTLQGQWQPGASVKRLHDLTSEPQSSVALKDPSAQLLTAPVQSLCQGSDGTPPSQPANRTEWPLTSDSEEETVHRSTARLISITRRLPEISVPFPRDGQSAAQALVAAAGRNSIAPGATAENMPQDSPGKSSSCCCGVIFQWP